MTLPLVQFYVNPMRAGLVLGIDGGISSTDGGATAPTTTGGAAGTGTTITAPPTGGSSIDLRGHSSVAARLRAGTKRRGSRRSRAFTLLEVMVAIAIIAFIALLIYGSFNIIGRGKRLEAEANDRSRQGRDAVDRIARELQSAFLSLHNPTTLSLITRTTAFIGTSGGNFDRVDFAAFAHRRFERDAHESDMCEVGYFVLRDPENSEKMDLVRREQTPIDMEPKKGGVVNVVAENVELFDLKYLDPITGLWSDTWDSQQTSAQPGRIPLEVRIELIIKGIPPKGRPYAFRTKISLPIQQPLSFGIPKQ